MPLMSLMSRPTPRGDPVPCYLGPTPVRDRWRTRSTSVPAPIRDRFRIHLRCQSGPARFPRTVSWGRRWVGDKVGIDWSFLVPTLSHLCTSFVWISPTFSCWLFTLLCYLFILVSFWFRTGFARVSYRLRTGFVSYSNSLSSPAAVRTHLDCFP